MVLSLWDMAGDKDTTNLQGLEGRNPFGQHWPDILVKEGVVYVQVCRARFAILNTESMANRSTFVEKEIRYYTYKIDDKLY